MWYLDTSPSATEARVVSPIEDVEDSFQVEFEVDSDTEVDEDLEEDSEEDDDQEDEEELLLGQEVGWSVGCSVGWMGWFSFLSVENVNYVFAPCKSELSSPFFSRPIAYFCRSLLPLT